MNVVVALGSERLYSDLVRRNNGQNTSGGDTVTVVKLEKSGGCVDRDEAYSHQFRQAQIREYFFGDSKNTLSPHTQQVDFSQLTIYKIIDPNADELSSSLLPGDYEAHDTSTGSIFEKLNAPTAQMQNAVLAIVHAGPNDPQETVRDASVIGFIFVAEVDEVKRKLKVLAPLSGRLPNRAVIWGKFPDGSGNLVG